jgi:DNA polymerase
MVGLGALHGPPAAGIDLALAESPVDRFAAPRAAPAPTPVPAQAAAPAAPAPQGQSVAAAAHSLEALEAALAAWDGCALKQRASRTVFADGNPQAPVMLVGEAPGSEEDRMGKPFVGRAGQLLDRMLGAIGLDREQVYIANMVPWRPPGNRNPTPEELVQCMPFLVRQVELVAPRILVTLGNTPTQALFGTSLGITRMRGQWRELSVGRHQARALPMLHPAFLLRTPGAKSQTWADLLSLKRAIAKETGGMG